MADSLLKAYAIMPGSFEDVIELLIPELCNRGIFWDGYAVPGGTYRENLYSSAGQAEPPMSHPASNYAWNPPECSNGVSESHWTGQGDVDTVDPVSMQLG